MARSIEVDLAVASAESWLSLREPPALEGQLLESHRSQHIEAASTLAVVALSNEPLLFLAGDLTMIAASASFCRAFQIDPASIPGRQFSELGDGEWAMPQLGSLLKATASGMAEIEVYEFDLVRHAQQTRHLLLNAHRLDDGEKERVRLLLAVTDVTDARAETREKDDLIREKTVLLQEVQHRVANSLQIIASILMQSARRMQSEEAKGHLQDAHHRVMSIAAVQRQLAVTKLGKVELQPYFSQLCESLGASMIHDPRRLSIAVTVDKTTVDADVSVSLGLIVTELVINALKHAFPGLRQGKIMVDYRSDGPNWTLSVGDDGIGMTNGAEVPKSGLGTGIVEALAKNLQGKMRLTDAQPGTLVSIVHGEAAGFRDVPAAA
jgi:two-component sensor histidine kinase